MATPKTTARPTTCGDLFVTHPTLAAEGCGRLPRHKGDHRSLLTISAVNKAARKASKKPAKVTRVTKADLAAAVQSVAEGKLAPSELLSLIASSQRKPKAVTKTTQVTKAPTSFPVGTNIVQFCRVVAKSGFAGQVVKIADKNVTVRSKTGEKRTFVMASLQRIAAKQQVANA